MNTVAKTIYQRINMERSKETKPAPAHSAVGPDDDPDTIKKALNLD